MNPTNGSHVFMGPAMGNLMQEVIVGQSDRMITCLRCRDGDRKLVDIKICSTEMYHWGHVHNAPLWFLDQLNVKEHHTVTRDGIQAHMAFGLWGLHEVTESRVWNIPGMCDH